MIFSLSDVYEFVEVWDWRNALQILSVDSNVFQDVNDNNQSSILSPDSNDYVFDEELKGERNRVRQDDDLFYIIVNNSTWQFITQLDNTLLEEQHVSDDSLEARGPTADDT